MSKVNFAAQIQGKSASITIEDDPSWGVIQSVLSKCIITNEQGQQNVNINNFFDEIVISVVEKVEGEGVAFNPKSRQAWKEMSGTEASAIIGEVISRLPLETYSKNLKLDGSPLLNIIQA